MRAIWILLGASLAIAAGLSLAARPEERPTRLSFLAVGQGDCTVLQHNGMTVLIDVGPRTDRFDAGERIVAPALRKLGVKTLDLIVLTHPDSDHTGGLQALARRFAIGRVVASISFQQHPEMVKTLQDAKIARDKVLWVNHAKFNVGMFAIEVVAPRTYPGESDNDGSLFAHVSGMKSSALMTGDASAETESTIVRAFGWKCDVLKGGHHGSKNSTGLRALIETKPKFVVFSCGRNNLYGHPAPEAVERVSLVGAKSYRTDRDGTITFVPSEKGFVRN